MRNTSLKKMLVMLGVTSLLAATIRPALTVCAADVTGQETAIETTINGEAGDAAQNSAEGTDGTDPAAQAVTTDPGGEGTQTDGAGTVDPAGTEDPSGDEAVGEGVTIGVTAETEYAAVNEPMAATPVEEVIQMLEAIDTLQQMLSVVVEAELVDIPENDIRIRGVDENQLSIFIVEILLVILAGCIVVLLRGKPQVMGWIDSLSLQFAVIHPQVLVVRSCAWQVLLHVQMVVFVRDAFTGELTVHQGDMVLDTGIRLADVLNGVLRMSDVNPKHQEQKERKNSSHHLNPYRRRVRS